ncbi:MAG: peptidyl-prolyl cis-trans isomerase [Betaproteobacteria bacterium]|nr:peptidyl-prolyl cis-trans isomerase [Betaproteobacteria bacterium]
MNACKLLRALGRALAALTFGLTLAASGTVGAQTVRLSTTLGDIELELHPDKAPATVANFLAYVKARHFDGLIFHRVIANFMVQTGGYTADLKQRPTRPPIPLESDNGLTNTRGSVAMARTADPRSATSQFYINVVDNPFLDKPNARDGQGYAVFATVTAGMDVVDQIRAVPTTAQGVFANLPNPTITILRASVVKP